ncbi:MAG: hypothetical protein JO214_20660 [Frankiaceae bacterium]|nr:hypothetical protein [Frankiaceae bacterium]
MSNVLDRPTVSTRASAQVEPAVAVWVRGAMAAAWAVAVGVACLVVLSLVVWAADSGSTANAAGAMRFAGQLWLLAHRVPMALPGGGALTIPPLALTLLAGALVSRGAAIVARTTECADLRDVGTVTAAVTAPYAVLATIIAIATPSAALRPSVGAAFVCAVMVGGVAAAIGAFRGSGLARITWEAMSAEARVALEGAAAATGVVFGASLLLAVGSLLAHSNDFGDLVNSYDGGAGEFAMVLLSALMLPNAMCFAVGYITGPGFAIGAGTSVTYGGSHLGAVPAFPLLAAVPSGPARWQIVVVFLATVVAAGVAAGWRVARADGLSMEERFRGALVAGAVLGGCCAVVVAFAGGPAGPGRLSAVGPSPWQVGLLVALEVSVVATITVVARQLIAKARHAA